MDGVLASLGWEALKPLLSVLALPPVPLLLLAVWGVRSAGSRQHRAAGWIMLAVALMGLWFASCTVLGDAVERVVLRPPPALSDARLSELKQLPAARKLAIVVLGGGREPLAPEYAEAHLAPRSMQRLHYAHWLARRLGAPLMFSGGVGREQPDGPAEADIASRISERDYGRRLRWTESQSRDTRENAAASVAMLAADGITDIVLVTHGWHMPRAQRAFEEASQRQRQPMSVVAAPMGLARRTERALFRWLPSAEGFTHVRTTVREGIGLLMGS